MSPNNARPRVKPKEKRRTQNYFNQRELGIGHTDNYEYLTNHSLKISNQNVAKIILKIAVPTVNKVQKVLKIRLSRSSVASAIPPLKT